MPRQRGSREDLRSRGSKEEPLLRMGKGGLSPGFVREVSLALSRRSLVKVRLLPSSRIGSSKEKMASELAERTSSELVEIRGNTVLLYRSKRRG